MPLGIMLSLIIVCIATLVWTTYDDMTVAGLLILIFLVLGLVILAVFGSVGLYNYYLEQDIAEHYAVEQTYNAALTDPRLSGLERIELTQRVVEHNAAMARRKVGLDKWWNVWLKDELVDEYKSLQPIGVGADAVDMAGWWPQGFTLPFRPFEPDMVLPDLRR